jgi:hypothetical protein
MRKILAVAVLALSLAPQGALAQERASGAAVGALSGAVVLGPVGALAGAVVGYTMGPSIAQGLRRSEPPPRARSAKRPPKALPKQKAAAQGASARASVAQDASAHGTAAHAPVKDVSGPSARAPVQSGGSADQAVPMQGFE